MLTLGLLVLRDLLEAEDSEELAELVEHSLEDGRLVHPSNWIDGAGK